MTSMTAYDTAKEKVIDKLSEELKLYRDNFILQSQKPIFIELIMLYDNLVQTLNNLEENQKTTNDAYLTVKQNLHNIKEELLEILHRRDIIPFHEHPELLDYKLHKTVSTVTTSIESENNKVDTILKTGFRWNDKVIRAEEVVIKKYRKSP
jgi:molecular chaperone GrpE (heat shock protein)